jgi:hypothetical protein
MGWLVSLILIGIIVWLFMNALNEKQWVDAHSHDDEVASDPGLFGSFTDATGTGSGPSLGDGSNKEKLQNAAAGVKQKTAQTGEMLGEKLAAARNSDMAGQLKDKTSDLSKQVKTKLDDSDIFHKIKDNVKKGADKLGEQVDAKIVGRKKPDA